MPLVSLLEPGGHKPVMTSEKKSAFHVGLEILFEIAEL
jgi:hypothetical protein